MHVRDLNFSVTVYTYSPHRSIKIGTISQSPEHILDNLKVCLPAVAKRIDGGWTNVQSLHIKTNSSISLPIWTCALGEGSESRWVASGGEEAAVAEWSGFGEESDGGSEMDDADIKTSKGVDATKGKKRVADEESKPPSKKARKIGVKNEKKAANQEAPKSKKGKEPSPVPDTPDSEENSEVPVKSSKSMKVEKPIPQKSSLKVEEIKQKRSSVGIEKKKEKVAKRKIGGSVKEDLVGKKAKSRI